MQQLLPRKDAGLHVSGRTYLWKVFDDGRPPEPRSFVWRPNQIQHTAGFVIAQCVGFGARAYKIAGMYIEFENLASPGDAVTPPTFGKDEGLDYYDALQDSGTRDYLRVPLLQNPLLGVVAGFEDSFGEEQGNKLTFFAQTQGSVGVHGKTFSDSVNSKVYGVALVATPTFSDRTQDVVFSRTYYSVGEQTAKEPSSQVGVSWDIWFTCD